MDSVNFSDVDLDSAAAIERLLEVAFADCPDRLRHIQVVAHRVKGTAFDLHVSGMNIDVDLAYRAALLHDIGYAAEIVDTGFHPVDGARFLIARGYPKLASYIICHSNSPEQAGLRGLPEMEISRHIIPDLITYWDVQVMQGGEVVSYQQRLTDIRERYGEESAVWQAHLAARPRIDDIRARVESLLGKS